MIHGVILVLAMPITVAVRAAESGLTWQACMAEAREHHPDLRAARFRLEAARIRRGSSFGGFLPKVDLEASRGRGRTTVPAGEALPGFDARLSANLSLFSGFATLTEMEQAAARERKAVAEDRSTEAEVRHDLRQAFAAALAAQELEVVREALAVRRRDNVALVTARVEEKKEDGSSRLQAEAEAGKADFEVARARRALARAQQRLSRAMGRRAFVPLALASDWRVDPPPEHPDLDALAAAGPRVTGAVAELAAARAGVREAGAAFWPAVDVSGSASREGPAWPPSDSRAWSTGLSLSLNLFHGLHDLNAVRIARLEAAQAEEELDSARRGAVETLEDALEPYANAWEAVEVRHTSLEAARARANDARTKYTGGTLQFDQWHEIEGGLAETEAEYLDARRESLDAEAGWTKAVGTGFP